MRDLVPYGPERREKIVRLHREGLTITELSHRFSCSYWTVRNEVIAQANGGVLPHGKGQKVNNWRSVAGSP